MSGLEARQPSLAQRGQGIIQLDPLGLGWGQAQQTRCALRSNDVRVVNLIGQQAHGARRQSRSARANGGTDARDDVFVVGVLQRPDPGVFVVLAPRGQHYIVFFFAVAAPALAALRAAICFFSSASWARA